MVSMICKKCKKEFDSEDIERFDSEDIEDIERFDRHLEYVHGIPMLQIHNQFKKTKALLEEIFGEA